MPAKGTRAALQIALTDPPDSFLEIAHHALRLEVGEVQLRNVG